MKMGMEVISEMQFLFFFFIFVFYDLFELQFIGLCGDYVCYVVVWYGKCNGCLGIFVVGCLCSLVF